MAVPVLSACQEAEPPRPTPKLDLSFQYTVAYDADLTPRYTIPKRKSEERKSELDEFLEDLQAFRRQFMRQCGLCELDGREGFLSLRFTRVPTLRFQVRMEDEDFAAKLTYITRF